MMGPTSDHLARRRSLLVAALAALRVKASEPELLAVHRDGSIAGLALA